VLLLALLACAAPDPLPLPSEEAAAKVDRDAQPPLYRQLYDYAFLPETQAAEQRVRILVWLRHMDFNRYQLGLLDELARRFSRERSQLQDAQARLVAEHEPQVRATYDRIWEGLNAGAKDADLARMGLGLDAVRAREEELLALRTRTIRSLLEAEAPFLATLTPQQEALFADATFLLRHRLDPYANPGDFQALVGTVYNVGEFGALSRTTFDPNEDHLDVAGLWSPEGSKLEQARFPDVKREVLLYMVLLEPSLPEAVAAALALRGSGEPAVTSAASGGGAPAGTPMPPPALPGAPGGTPLPGVPVAPTPGTPMPPAPVAGSPAPVAPSTAGAGVPTPPKPGIATPPAPGKPSEPPPR
jgi:hypothetical protein